MNTTLVIREKGIPKNSALAKSEHELYEAMSGAFESFYSQGVILKRMLVDKEYKDAGYESFDKYMNERQPCGIKKSYAWQLIAAVDVRPRLPTIDSTDVESGMWTEASIRPLLHKDFEPSDQKRLGKKIATLVKNGEKLTAALVKHVCDEDRGVERRASEKKQAEVAETPTAGGTLAKIFAECALWKQSLGNVPDDFFKEAVAEDSESVTRLIRILGELSSILVEKSTKRRRV
jgi:hypothetical protein